MNNSPQAAQASALQAMMKNSSQAQLMQATQRMADDAALQVMQQKQGSFRPTFQMKAGMPARDGQGVSTVQGKLMPQTGGGKVIQAVTDGTKVSLPLLGYVAENETKLKQWDGGEFYARDLSLEAKDERHAHAYDLKLADAKVSLGGHVVTAKGVQGGGAAEEAKRNQTTHKFVGEKGAGNVWEVPDPAVNQIRKELPQGRNANGAVLKADHDGYAKNIRDELHVAFSKMLNMPDAAVDPGKKAAGQMEAALVEKRKAELKKAAEEREKNAPEIDYGGIGSLPDDEAAAPEEGDT
ncbi:hypothetical protein ACO0LM_27170 [Undibacterium sp. Di26W]|uniref:hypothetical protein n=1 Tax=Undibacterium sp. Di26W TaxID=3413035 RepID=UPI003BF3712C